ncbi:MAG TPA: hypothetical protein VK716_15920 [Terracidiphilus sp.]|jgi:hypothetical protein|nr:hypothetical protein [Terracidiphilus sp.]
MATSSSTRPQITHQGPPLLLPALTYTALVFGGVGTLRAVFSIPMEADAQVSAYITAHCTQIQWGSFCEFGSAIPLGVFVATAVSRLHFLRVRAAGVTIALVGGIGAIAMLLFSALAAWSLTRPGIATADSAVRMLKALSFASGGPGFVVPLGLFFAGISLTAGLYRFIPRWLMILGLVIAVACELASFTLVYWNAAFFIPFGRFIGIVWMIAIALLLPRKISAERAER